MLTDSLCHKTFFIFKNSHSWYSYFADGTFIVSTLLSQHWLIKQILILWSSNDSLTNQQKCQAIIITISLTSIFIDTLKNTARHHSTQKSDTIFQNRIITRYLQAIEFMLLVWKIFEHWLGVFILISNW